MKKTLCLFVLMLTFQSCLNVIDPEHQAEYIHSYKSFDINLVNHFPRKIPNNWTMISYGTPDWIKDYNSIDFILEIQVASEVKFEELRNQLKEKAQAIKNSTDSCLLIVNSKEGQSLMNCENCYPVPQESICKLDSCGWIMKENCEVVLLDYQS